MKFKIWFESDENQERISAFDMYIKSLTDLANKYNTKLHPNYIEHEKKIFMTMPIEELRKEIINLPKYLKEREQDFIRSKIEKEAKEKRARGMFKGYYRADNKYERVVCSEGDPEFHIKGMPAYPMGEIDHQLKKYYGIHVGGGWLGILKRDGYCDSGDAYLYTIHADEMLADGILVYEMEDPHVAYRDIATPDSQIIFSKYKIIPAKYIELDKVIPEDEIKEYPPPYGMD